MAWTEQGQSTHTRPQLEPKYNQHRTGISLKTLPTTLSLGLAFLLLSISPHLGLAGPPQPARAPLLSGQPFIIVWGIRDSTCSGRSDPGSFGMEREGRVAVFYEDTLGNYPYFEDQDTPVNGGLPQHTRLENHIQKVQGDLVAALPAPRYLGLGVLRWGKWAPQWSRNREKQAVYLDASRALLKAFFPEWTPEEVEKWSQVDFEAAAQSIMTETLQEVRKLRPKALWGVSPYPSCYNADPTQTLFANYTGRCPVAEMALNDEMLWLWKRCSALYPLLTLEKLQGGTSGARLYLSNQIREALRVASLAGTAYDLPVFPIVKSSYASTSTFLSQADLISTIGESAAMGAAGVVIWERKETKTERECSDLAEFVCQVLGPYSVNVTTATRLCSASLCQGRGRCVRQNPESSTYLHLPPPADVVEKVTDKVTTERVEATTATKPTDQPAPGYLEIWKRDFQCQWFKASDGAIDDLQSPKDGASDGGRGVGRAVDMTGPTVGPAVGTSTSASGAQLGEGGTMGTGSPKPTLQVPTDHGMKLLNAPMLTVLILLLASALCLDP